MIQESFLAIFYAHIKFGPPSRGAIHGCRGNDRKGFNPIGTDIFEHFDIGQSGNADQSHHVPSLSDTPLLYMDR